MLMVYVPGGRADRVYTPSLLVTVSRVKPVPWSCAITVAPATADLLVSVTLPLIVPCRSCARALQGPKSVKTSSSIAKVTGSLGAEGNSAGMCTMRNEENNKVVRLLTIGIGPAQTVSASMLGDTAELTLIPSF